MRMRYLSGEHRALNGSHLMRLHPRHSNVPFFLFTVHCTPSFYDRVLKWLSQSVKKTSVHIGQHPVARDSRPTSETPYLPLLHASSGLSWAEPCHIQKYIYIYTHQDSFLVSQAIDHQTQLPAASIPI